MRNRWGNSGNSVRLYFWDSCVTLGSNWVSLDLDFLVGKIEAVVVPASQVVQRMKASMQEEDLP